MHWLKQQADTVIDQVIKKNNDSLRDMSNADHDKQAGLNNCYVIVQLGDFLRKGALVGNPLADTIKSLEDMTVQENFDKKMDKLEKLIMSI